MFKHCLRSTLDASRLADDRNTDVSLIIRIACRYDDDDDTAIRLRSNAHDDIANGGLSPLRADIYAASLIPDSRVER